MSVHSSTKKSFGTVAGGVVPASLIHHMRSAKTHKAVTRPGSPGLKVLRLGLATPSSTSVSPLSPGSLDLRFASFTVRSSLRLSLSPQKSPINVVRTKADVHEKLLERALSDVKSATGTARAEIYREYAGNRVIWLNDFRSMFAFKDYASQARHFRNRQRMKLSEDVLTPTETKAVMQKMKRVRRNIIVR